MKKLDKKELQNLNGGWSVSNQNGNGWVGGSGTIPSQFENNPNYIVIQK